MASNKNSLNFNKIIEVCGQSNFVCVFCNKQNFNVFSENIGIEHIFNQNFDRKDIKGMRLACNECNKKHQDNSKPFDSDKIYAENLNYILTDDKAETIIYLLMKYNDNLELSYCPNSVSGSRRVSKATFEKMIQAKLKIENEKLTNETYKEFNELKEKLAKLENEMIKSDLQKVR